MGTPIKNLEFGFQPEVEETNTVKWLGAPLTLTHHSWMPPLRPRSPSFRPQTMENESSAHALSYYTIFSFPKRERQTERCRQWWTDSQLWRIVSDEKKSLWKVLKEQNIRKKPSKKVPLLYFCQLLKKKKPFTNFF